MEPGGLIVLAALFVGFWLLVLRPQRRRAQEQRTLHESVAVGDEIVTLGGLLGRVKSIDETDDTLEVEIAPGTSGRRCSPPKNLMKNSYEMSENPATLLSA